MGIETAIAVASAVAGLATAGATVASTLSSKAPSPPKIEEPSLLNENKELALQEEKRRKQLVAQKGRSSSILTSPLGLKEDSDKATPSLLGN